MNPLGTQLLAEFTYCHGDLLRDLHALETILKDGIEQSGFHLISLNSYQFSPAGATILAIIGESHIAIHSYPEALHATIDIFTCSSHHDQYKLLNILKERLDPKTVRVIEVQRGNPIEVKKNNWLTESTTKGFDVRYHIQKDILSIRSKYQKINIIDNENFGRMLFLDNELQISEIDAPVYNAELIGPLLQSRQQIGKVAILGGGDGGVLHELLKHRPQKVVLVEIDEEVIRVCEKFLPGLCNGGFQHPDVEIIINDANLFLENNSGFDAIIYDLTMHPESFTDKDRSIYLDEIFFNIKSSLSDQGIISLQCCSEFDTETVSLLEGLLSKYFTDLVLTKTFLPSFCGNWVFASAVAM